MSMTDQELIDAGLKLARLFYKNMGYEVAEGYKFYDSTHPQEQAMWNLAVIAFEEIRDTDLESVLADIAD